MCHCACMPVFMNSLINTDGVHTCGSEAWGDGKRKKGTDSDLSMSHPGGPFKDDTDTHEGCFCKMSPCPFFLIQISLGLLHVT